MIGTNQPFGFHAMRRIAGRFGGCVNTRRTEALAGFPDGGFPNCSNS
jgi:hypothetical protein